MNANGAAAERFTVGEKIRSLVVSTLSVEPADPRGRVLLRSLHVVIGFRLHRPLVDALPPLENEEEWHQLLGLLVGLLLNLPSDGYELDVDACRRAGATMLAEFMGG